MDIMSLIQQWFFPPRLNNQYYSSFPIWFLSTCLKAVFKIAVLCQSWNCICENYGTTTFCFLVIDDSNMATSKNSEYMQANICGLLWWGIFSGSLKHCDNSYSLYVEGRLFVYFIYLFLAINRCLLFKNLLFLTTGNIYFYAEKQWVWNSIFSCLLKIIFVLRLSDMILVFSCHKMYSIFFIFWMKIGKLLQAAQ